MKPSLKRKEILVNVYTYSLVLLVSFPETDNTLSTLHAFGTYQLVTCTPDKCLPPAIPEHGQKRPAPTDNTGKQRHQQQSHRTEMNNSCSAEQEFLHTAEEGKENLGGGGRRVDCL